jgi:ribosomal protein S18 acetylase RimI-like enzyme
MKTQASFVVRRADLRSLADQQAVRSVLNAYAADPMGGGEPLAEDVMERLIPGLRAHPTALVMLAFADDQAVGIAVWFMGFSTFTARPLINVHDLAVIPPQRGRGVGRALLRAVEQEARQLGCGKITLEVRHDNAVAQGLYRAEGFDHPGGVAHHFWAKKI